MAWQLVYTSAPRGLALGQSGFCTVARHAGLRERLVAEIERFSGYAHLYTPSPDGRDSNPVISCHRILTVGGTRYHVLSRIRAAGFDYTRRTNHIAHHLICQSQEVAQAVSPAHMLRAWEGWQTRWQGEPRYFEDKDQVPLRDVGQPLPLPGKNWEAVAHDPRFAALLMEPALQSGCHVVGPPQSEDLLLRLFEESLRLLDPKNEQPSRQWQIPFTTFLQSTDNAEDFIWRGCRKDRPLPAAAVSGRVVDLTNPARLVLPTNAYVEVARTGARQEARPGEMSAQNSRLSPGPGRARGPISIGTLPTSSRQGRISVSTPAMVQPVRWFDNKLLLIIGGVVSVLLLAIIALLVFMVFRPPKEQPPAASVTPQAATAQTQPVQAPPPTPPPVVPTAPQLEPPPRTASVVAPGAPGRSPSTPGTPVAVPAPAPEETAAASPKKAGRRHPAKAAATVSPPAQIQPPIYLVTEQQSIDPILGHYFGNAFTPDLIGNGIKPSVQKFSNNQWPKLEPVEQPVEFISGKFYANGNPVISLDLAERKLRVLATGNDMLLLFWPTSQGAWNRTEPFFMFLLSNRQTSPPPPPLFTYGTDSLVMGDSRDVRIGGNAMEQLARLRLLSGAMKLWMNLNNQKWWSSNSVLQVGLRFEAPAFDKLSLGFKDVEKSYEVSIESKGKGKTELEAQLQLVQTARNLVTTAEPFVSAGDDLLKRAGMFAKARRMTHFDSYWDNSPKRKSGKALPDWEDYADYLKDVCLELMDVLYGARVQPSEESDIRKLLQEVADKNMAGFSRIPSRIEGLFGAKFKHRKYDVVIDNPRRGGKGEPDQITVKRDRFDPFAKAWEHIFSDANAAKLIPLRLSSPQQQKIQQQRIAQLAREIEQLKKGKETLPKSLDQIGEVWLEWEPRPGETVPLALFKKNK